MKEFKVLYLGSCFIFLVALEHEQYFRDTFLLSNNIFDFIEDLDFMKIRYEYLGQERADAWKTAIIL